MKPKEQLQKHFLQLEKQQRVSKENPKNQLLEKQVREIVVRALDKIVKKDQRFEYKLHGTGSYYDGVKVGHPDEFDYLVELAALSSQNSMKYMPTEVPGFVQIRPARDMFKLWQDCLTLPSDLKNSSASQALYHTFPGESGPFTDTRGLTDDQLNEILENQSMAALSLSEKESPILAPTLLQTTFKKHFDEVMFQIDLPDHWVHGGHNRPHYSGCRRHGPATMIQLVYTNKTEEIKLNIDITLGIAVPFPVNFPKQLNMNVFNNFKYDSQVHKILNQVMQCGPNIHLIPLYSKMLVQTRHFNDKFSFRISCSCIEKEILDFWPDNSGPKKCMRIMKIIRDQYFSEGKRKTYRGKKKTKKRSSTQTNSEANEQENKQCTKFTKKKITAQEYVERVHTAENQWSHEMERNENILQDKTTREEQIEFKASAITTECTGIKLGPCKAEIQNIQNAHSKVKINEESQKQDNIPGCIIQKKEDFHDKSTVQNKRDVKELTVLTDGTVSETTDITEVEENKTKQEAFKKFQQTRFKYQTRDISDMVSEPGSGEYYGPRTYLASIEIKTYILRLLAKYWDPNEWTDEKVCEHTEFFLKTYHTLLLDNKMIKSFFFDTFVCSPISPEQRLKALENYNKYQRDMNNILEQVD